MSEMGDTLLEVIEESANEVAALIVEEARFRLSEPYPPSSQPGEWPHTRTGYLLESIYSRVVVEGQIVTIEYGSDAEYAYYLEYGTDRMEPRPMWEGLQSDVNQYLENIAAQHVSQRFEI